jgi:hypothetical protein
VLSSQRRYHHHIDATISKGATISKALPSHRRYHLKGAIISKALSSQRRYHLIGAIISKTLSSQRRYHLIDAIISNAWYHLKGAIISKALSSQRRYHLKDAFNIESLFDVSTINIFKLYCDRFILQIRMEKNCTFDVSRRYQTETKKVEDDWSLSDCHHGDGSAN